MSTASHASGVTAHMDDVTDDAFTMDSSQRRSRKIKLRDAAETVLIGDSTIKHVDGKRYMGRTPSFIQRASTASIALDVLETWTPNSNVKFAVLHVGVNDVRDGLSACDISENVKSCMNQMHTIFPNACIAFSEILYIGRTERDSAFNECITQVNDNLERFIEGENYLMIRHPRLQSPQSRLYDDDIHINKDGGTAVFISKIHNTTGWRSYGARQDTETDGERRPYNNRNQRPARNQRLDISSQNPRKPTSSRRGNDESDMDQMLKLLTLSVLRNYQGNI